MSKIGLFGGCFNPITKAHIISCIEALKYLDQVWLVPTYKSLHGKILECSYHRIRMCELAISDLSEEIKSRIKICCYEIDNKIQDKGTGKIIHEIINSYNLNTSSLYFIIGVDNFNKINEWIDQEIILKFKYIVIPRDGYIIDVDKTNKIDHIIIDCLPIKGSSTQVRIEKDITKCTLLNENVLEYIILNKLYSEKI